MSMKRLRPPVLADRRGAQKKWGTDNPFVTTPHRFVNRLRLLAAIKFRNLTIAGIALAGWPKCPWLSRLVDRLTVLADALAEKSGVRA